MDLMAMARQFPEMTVSIRACDLIAANEALVRKVRAEVEREQDRRAKKYGEQLIKKEDARVILGKPHPTTMWRWENAEYLHKVKIGNSVFYRKSEIEGLIKSKEVKNTR